MTNKTKTPTPCPPESGATQNVDSQPLRANASTSHRTAKVWRAAPPPGERAGACGGNHPSSPASPTGAGETPDLACRHRGRTRIGKIARLPQEIREQLNCRLQDGEPGEDLLRWLNRLPKVRKVLAAQFGGRPINKQNLSDWKLGGYRDWERAEEDRERIDRLTEQAQLASPDPDNPLSKRLAAVLLVELARALDDLRDESLPPAGRWDRLRQMLREVAAMRREDHRAAKLGLEEDRWWLEREKLWRENRRAEERELLTASLMAGAFRKKEKRRKKHSAKASGAVKPGQGESSEGIASDGSDRADRGDESAGQQLH